MNEERIKCPFCGESISKYAKICRFCRNQIFSTNVITLRSIEKPIRYKGVMIILAFFFGNVGIHNFYIEKNSLGILKICLSLLNLILCCTISNYIPDIKDKYVLAFYLLNVFLIWIWSLFEAVNVNSNKDGIIRY